MESRGVVVETTSNGDQVLMGEAANEESLASDPRGPVNAAQSARLLYRRLAEMFATSPLASEAAWRAADILWQIQKTDASTRPSAKERDAYLRDQMDEDELKKVIKLYPRTRPAAGFRSRHGENAAASNVSESTVASSARSSCRPSS